MTTTVYTLNESATRRLTNAERRQRIRARRRAACVRILQIVVAALYDLKARLPHSFADMWRRVLSGTFDMMLVFISLCLMGAVCLLFFAFLTVVLNWYLAFTFG